MDRVNAFRARLIKNPSAPELIAATIFQAANDPSDRLRYLAGSDAKRLWQLRSWLGYRAQIRISRKLVGL
jgi:hypothetical protein